jgi:arylalkylamine N-acetyltransferase
MSDGRDTFVKIATAADLQLIHAFLSEHFHNLEPIEVSHRMKHEKVQPNDDYLLSCIDCNTTLMAYTGDVLVGVLIAGTIFANEHERNLEASKLMSGRNEKHADVLRFLSYIDEKANYCSRLHVPEALHIHIIAVHGDFKGRGIARTLFECCVENGRKFNYQAVTVDCTSHYTARIAEQRAFSLISTVTYDEYHDFIGERLFEPSFPHMQINSYALILKNSADDYEEHTIL